jgi:hypothetical protein
MVALIAALALVAAYPLSSPREARASGVTVSDLNQPGVTPDALANALVGPGVTVSGVTYTGAKRAAGKFSGGASSILFDNGIILDTGKVQTYPTDLACSQGVEGPNTCHENPPKLGTENTTAFGTSGDTQLTALSGFTTYDAAILEFDFVPQFAGIQFKYVFSSDEYSDYSNTQFNDVFAFFINGTNCALTPDGKPVSVNTINNGNDITGGDTTPHNPLLFRDNVRPTPGTIDSQMDGLTTVLTCTATVNPGVNNHMKLAIADASDRLFDSAVFLQGGSLISVVPTVTTTTLHGGGQNGPAITVPQGTAVTDSATLTGANASKAGGTMTYTVYSDATCSTVFASGGVKTVVNGTVPDSNPVTMSQIGTFHWIAAYSGDTTTGNAASSSNCVDETVTVTGDAPISATGTSFSATEGQLVTATVATVKDGDPNDMAAEYKATIDWGDGTAPSVVVLTGPNGGPYSVTGTHTYAEEGTYTVKVHVTDSDSTNTADTTSTARVADAALTSSCPTPATATTKASTAPPISTQTFAGSTARFNDSSTTGTPNDFTATINWGDSMSSAGTIAGGPGIAPYTVSGSHTYSTTGTFTVTTTINDVGGASTSVKCQLLVAGFPTANGGTFVVGDLEAMAPPMIGNSLTWWSSQWAIINQMSLGPAPSSMKGFAGFEDMALPSPLPPLTKLCGMKYTTDTGNSTPPPPSVPTDMLVFVSSQITQNGSVITGDIREVIVVHNNPGYAPDPGHTGTGTEEAIVCTS